MCVARIDSYAPKFRYDSRYINRPLSDSSLSATFGCGMLPLDANLATGIVVGPVNVEFTGVAKFGRNLNRLSAPESSCMK